ncbi:exodeoxyribonuclease V subunit gamma [Thioalkalivibrio sp.]|uniref:exodeoxyribonuclease V subunit gamma n=1 Tax=Thioalkalivibrio sp. TaxID=2093813 RepID=UPI003565E3EA
MTAAQVLQPGFMVVHGNRMHDLRALAVEWMRRHPLDPLENETILVQSNGIAQWLKLALARDRDAGGCGIAAALEMELPARFLWAAYRAVLGPEAVPADSPFAKAPLTWRLMRLLPELLDRSEFAPLERFLGEDDGLRKRWQLARQLADLFDQYQVYRADWLADWAAGRDQLRDAGGAIMAMDAGQRWQASLWRAVRADMDPDQREQSRAAVHRRFMERVRSLNRRPPDLPRRIVVFGISSLPSQSLEALEGLARLCQVLLCVHNPCEYYWADIVADRDLLRAAARRQKPRPGMPAQLTDPERHQHAHPLLAAWGKQGRDYIRLLDEHDDPERYRALLEALPWQRIDLFEAQPHGRLLGQVQDDIRALRPLHETRERWPAVAAARDGSLRFHVAHSPQREVEVLHDELLERFQRDPGLRPRDVIVMVPDVETYAPHVQAVFGQLDSDDPRFIPFTLSDRSRRRQEPLVAALEGLLDLPESRFAVSDLLDLVEVPAVRRRFGIEGSRLHQLHAWIEGSGIRWGLDARQRATLGLPEGLEQNTWRFGLRRMLLGYAVAGPWGRPSPWAGIEPFDEIGGLDAALAGQLARLLDALNHWWGLLRQPAAPGEWVTRLRGLLDAFFTADEEREQWLLSQLDDALEDWEADCAAARLEEPLPLTVVRESWLEAVDQPGLAQRFLGGAVNFCTLLPMRAIPFRVVCLLGMNDGDYPRAPVAMDFDLMARDYRPGDRSRREDDRYLFLEALLSARDQLYVSWVGRSVRDNAERPPSVLVGQLRDHIASGWQLEGADGDSLLRALTVVHPLQPFSRDNFPADGEGPLFTYAREWAGCHHAPPPDEGGPASLPRCEPEGPLRPEDLGGFLRNPVQSFFNRRLGVYFDEDVPAPVDQEPFALDGLAQWQLRDALVDAALEPAGDPTRWPQRMDAALAGLQRAGRLPLAAVGTAEADGLRTEVAGLLERYRLLAAEYPLSLEETQPLHYEHQGIAIEGELAGLRGDRRGGRCLLLPRPGNVTSGRKAVPRHDVLLYPWVVHLLANAHGLGLTTRIVGTDGALRLPPMPEERCAATLRALVEGWREGQSRPAPVALQAALAWLQAEAEDRDPHADALRAYEGSEHHAGDLQRSPYHRRMYPDPESLLQDPGFRHWTDMLYRPLFEVVREAGA